MKGVGLSFQDYKVNYTVCDNNSAQTCAVHKHGSRTNNDTVCPLIAPFMTFQKRNDKMKGLISFVGLKFEAYEKKRGSLFQMEMRQGEQRWMDKKDDKDLPFSTRNELQF